MSGAEPDPHAPPVRRFADPAYRPLARDLAEVRANIDRLDREIVALLAERGRWVKDAARFKRDPHQVAAPARQAAVFARVRALAVEARGEPDVIEAAYRTLVAGFIAREQAWFDEMEHLETDR